MKKKACNYKSASIIIYAWASLRKAVEAVVKAKPPDACNGNVAARGVMDLPSARQTLDQAVFENSSPLS